MGVCCLECLGSWKVIIVNQSCCIRLAFNHDDLVSNSWQFPFKMAQLLREISHENVVKLVNVHINPVDMSLYLAFDYADHDLYVSNGPLLYAIACI